MQKGVIIILHLGDITKIDGGVVPRVHIITGGSPCQDLSVAGRRKGLAGERSGLFMEQMRIVKQMREASKQELIAEFGENYDKSKVIPRYMIWENVCFCADTQIMTINGLKAIQDVQIGDQVLTHNHRYMPVVETYVHTDKEVVQVNIIGEQPLICTPNHPIYGCKKNPDGSYGELEFIPAGLLTSEHRVASFWNDKIAYKAIESVVPLDKKETVYNLSVLEDNTYVANGIICHNCGAYSSGNPAGSDFAAVLEEITRVVVSEVPPIHVPEQGWSYSGCFEGVGDEGTPFSICWRTHDAQYWGKTILDNSGRVVKAGTPQRRRRIALVADFGGQSAPEILFESDSMQGNSEQSRETREATPGTSGTGTEESGTTVIFNDHDVNPQTSEAIPIYNHPQGSELSFIDDGVSQTLTARAGTGGNNTPMVFETQPTIAIEGNGSRDSHKGDGYSESDVMYTLNTVEQHAVCTTEPVLLESNQNHATVQTDGVATTLPASMGEGGGYVPMVVDEQKSEIKQEGCDLYNLRMTGEVSATLSTLSGTPDGSGGKVLMTNVPTYGVELGAASRLGGHVTEEVAPTLRADMGDNQTAVVVNVETEVSVRKYEVDVPRLIECLQTHRQNMSIKDLAATLDKPKTLVEHWFRKDKCFAIPDADIWMKLKELLKIDTDEFDKSIMTFETKAGSYDTSNRIHMGDVTPTLTASGENTMYCVEQGQTTYGIDQQGGKGMAGYSEDVMPTLASDSHGTPHAVCYGISSYDSNAMKSDNPNSGIYKADTARTLDLNGGNPACNQGGMMVVQPNEELSNADKEQIEDWVDAVNSSAKHQLVTSAVADKPIKESVRTYGVTTKGNGDAFIAEERHTALSTGGGEAGQGYPCALVETNEPICVQRRFSSANVYEDGVTPTLEAGAGEGDNNMPLVMDNQIQDVTGTLGARTYKNSSVQEAESDMFVITPEVTAFAQNEREEVRDLKDVAGALSAEPGIHQQTYVAQTYQDTTGALCASGYDKLGTQEAANDMYVVQDTPPVQCMEVFHCTTEDDVSHPIKARDYKDPQVVAIDMGAGKSQCGITEEQSPTLTTTHGGEPAVCGFSSYSLGETGDVGCTLTAAGGGLNEHTPCVYEKQTGDGSTYGVSGTSSKFGVGKDLSPAQTAAHPNMVSTTSVVRRLTPLECERLQGFPDNWTDIGDWVDENGKKHKASDSPRYKALGNSIALPFWDWMAGRMCAKLRESGVENPKLMSLFDGISGFPLVFARHGCTPVSSSEIEQFPIAVCKKHFGDDATGDKGDYEQYL